MTNIHTSSIPAVELLAGWDQHEQQFSRKLIPLQFIRVAYRIYHEKSKYFDLRVPASPPYSSVEPYFRPGFWQVAPMVTLHQARRVRSNPWRSRERW